MHEKLLEDANVNGLLVREGEVGGVFTENKAGWGDPLDRLYADGCRAWSELYEKLVERVSVAVEIDTSPIRLSVGQAAELLVDGNDVARAAIVKSWEATWAEEAELLAYVLNQLSALRLARCRHRGWESALPETLASNRVFLQTVRAVWQAIEQSAERFAAF